MKFNYQFSNLLGTVYRKGSLLFTPDGNSVISPVGNKISIYDLKNHKSATLPIETRFNVSSLALSPNGILLIAIDEDGEISLISLISKTVLHRLRTNRTISAVSFSPDGKRFAFCKENIVQVYRSPGPHSREYNPFMLDRVLKGAFDDTTCIAWSSCSRIVAVGSKDNTTRLYALDRFTNFSVYCLGGNTDPVVATFFERNSLVCYTLSRNGQLSVWESSLHPDELEVDVDGSKSKLKILPKKRKPMREDVNDDDDDDDSGEEVEDESRDEDKSLVADDQATGNSKLFYKRLARHFLRDAIPTPSHKKDQALDKEEERKLYIKPDVMAADFNGMTHILVTGFSNGVFLIHELPEAQLIHSLSISDQSILAVTLNPNGDWIAFGCEHLGQLLVWEWQSETFVLKQQGHFNNMACLAYSPDGSVIATGGEDGKVKLWNVASGFCFVTFSEHTSSISGIVYTPNGKVVLSASLDGSVRAFDTMRYRNFRTFTSPRPAQFGCVSIDASGELVAAGGIDVFEVFLWSLQTGRLLEVISAHEGPVSSLAFCPSTASSQLATVSWDKTLRLWDALSVGTSSESIQLVSDATAVAFRPDGHEVAVATINGHISFFDTRSNLQTGSIEGRNDLHVGRSDTDLITAKKTKEGKGYFGALSYTADGSCILAGGQSKVICIYHVKEALLIKKFELTQNRSFEGMDDVISRKKMSEFGNLALVEDRDDSAGSTTIKLPGTRRGDMSSRAAKPEVRVSGLHFSPTGRDFAVTSTEGLLIYSLDSRMFFDPFELEMEITPAATRSMVKSGEDYGRALLMSLKLNEHDLIREILEQVPVHEIDLISSNLPEVYVTKLLKFLGTELESTKHIHFYGTWCHALLTHHGLWLKSKANDHMPVLNLLQRNLTTKTKTLGELCESNLYSMKFLLNLAELKKAAVGSKGVGEGDEAAVLSDSDQDEDMDVQEMEGLQSKWSDDNESESD